MFKRLLICVGKTAAGLVAGLMPFSLMAAPAQITCAYDPFGHGADGPVIQRLVLDGDAYVDADPPRLLRFRLTEDRTALHLVHTAGGAITAIAIEKSDGSMLMVSAATFGTVQHSRGTCRLD
jgi:hypothetical protein